MLYMLSFRDTVHPFEQLVQIFAQSGYLWIFARQMQREYPQAFACHIHHFLVLLQLVSRGNDIFDGLGYFDVVGTHELDFSLGAVIVNLACLLVF